MASLDRLGRRLVEAIRCREELKRLSVAVHSVREGGELPDLAANILAAVAQDKIRRRRDRMKAAREHLVGHLTPGLPWSSIIR